MKLPNPVLESIGGRKWRVVEDLHLELRLSVLGQCTLTIPAGFETDLATVPRFMWWAFPPSGDYNLAAIVHDYLLVHRRPEISKKFCDEVFREIMHLTGVYCVERCLMYWAVRWFGGDPQHEVSEMPTRGVDV